MIKRLQKVIKRFINTTIICINTPIYTDTNNHTKLSYSSFTKKKTGLATPKQITVKSGEIEKIGFGWEKWRVNQNKRLNPFIVNLTTCTYGFAVTSCIVLTTTWLIYNTLQLDLKMVDQEQGYKFTCAFENEKIFISLLSSVSEGNKKITDQREKIVGILT